jgi:transposase InsO family protein
MPLMLTDTPSVVFEKCSVDIIGPLSTSVSGNRYILTVQDDLSKCLIAVPMKDQTAEDVSKASVENFILVYGLPQVVLSDCGDNFLSDIFMGICKLLGIKKIKTTPFPPESNGSNERSHRSLTEYLRSYVDADLSNWDQWVRYAAFAHNTTPQISTNYMPFQLLYGRLPNLPEYLQKDPTSVYYAYDRYVKELESRLQSSYVVVRRNLETAKLDNKKAL